MIFVLIMMFTCTSLFAGSFKPGYNPKYQTKITVCKADGHPNFETPLAPNPNITGFTVFGTAKCEHPASTWTYQNSMYQCFNSAKAEFYGCTFNS